MIRRAIYMINGYLTIRDMIDWVMDTIYMKLSVDWGWISRTRLIRSQWIERDQYLYVYRVGWSFWRSSIFYGYGNVRWTIPDIGKKTYEQYRQELTMSRYNPARVMLHIQSQVKEGVVYEQDITESIVKYLGPMPRVNPLIPTRRVLEDIYHIRKDELSWVYMAYYPQNVDWMMELILSGQDYVVYRGDQLIGS